VPVWSRFPDDEPSPPVPTHSDTPAFGVDEQLSVGTVQLPMTSLTTVAPEETAYPDQLRLWVYE
jgi:hypothetical protein